MIDVRTTSLLVQPIVSENINLHNQTFVRYVLSSAYYVRKKEKGFYGKIQNEIAEKLDAPYYFYTYDQPLPAIYALISEPHVPDICLSDFSTLHKEVITADDAPLHVLLKVLLARYIRSQREHLFTSQGKHYIWVKGSGKWLTSLEMGVRASHDKEEAGTFRVFNHARRLVLFDQSNPSGWKVERQAFFGRMAPKDGRVILRALKRSEVLTYPNDLYQPVALSQSPAKLNFHDDDKLEQTRGWQIHKFMEGFTEFLETYGLEVAPQRRSLEKYKPLSKKHELPRSKLKTIYVLDNRLNQDTIHLDAYVDYLGKHFSELNFSATAQKQLSPQTPVLVLQDCKKEDFEEDGRLAGQVDPKKALYAETKDVPKQTINVNLDGATKERYLEYSGPLLGGEDFQEDLRRKLEVSLNQLFLKSVVLGCLPSTALPLFHDAEVSLRDYVFVRRGVYGSYPIRQRYTVAMWAEGEALRFVNLGSSVGKEALQAQLERQNIDWLDDVVSKFENYHYLEDDEVEPASYDFVMANGKVVEIENIDERVLHEYDEIMHRRRRRREPLPIDEFKLLPDAHKLPYMDRRALEVYDDFLNSLKEERSRLSFVELCEEPLFSSIVPVLNLRTRSGRPYTRKLFDVYRDVGKFLSPKGGNVIPTYQGIWYEEGLHYIVGSKTSFNKKQPKAHLVRRFALRKGENLDVAPLLESLSVTFVRHGQYTVLPYPFHLIDLWADISLT